MHLGTFSRPYVTSNRRWSPIILPGVRAGNSFRSIERRKYGTVDQITTDGFIIWFKDDLNVRRLFHFRDCQSLILMAVEKPN